VPTIYKMLLDAVESGRVELGERSLRHVRWFISGGAPLPTDLVEAYRRRGVVLKQGYGLTEVGVNCFAMSDEDSVRKAGSIGQPFMFTQARLVDPAGKPVARNEVGELCLRGPHVCLGYWKNPAGTAQVLDADGWFHTGDLARCDEDGFFYIARRSKDMIISGGVNIYPAEIEKEMLDHPAIAEVAVIAAADVKWGEVPVAFIALKSGATASEAELIEFLGTRLSRIKLPRRVVFVEALPRNAYGKVLKLELQERLHREF